MATPLPDFFPLRNPPTLLSLAKPLSNHLGLQTLPYHIHEVALSFLFYHSIFKLLSPALSRRVAPTAYGKLDRRGKLNWDAHVVSMVQSLLVNSLALYVIARDPGRAAQNASWRERLWGYSPAGGMVQGLAAGYFVWDVLVSVLHTDVMGVGSLVHAVAALGVTGLGFRPFANYYGLNFILYELSTPNLNVHWFCDKLGLTGSNLQLYNGILLLTTFFFSRLVWGSYQSYLIYGDVYKAWHDTTASSAQCAAYRLFKDGKTFTRSGLDVPPECRVLPKWLALLYIGGNSVLCFLNFYWFNKMVAAVRKRFVKKDGKGGPKRNGDVIPRDLSKEMEPEEGKEHFE